MGFSPLIGSLLCSGEGSPSLKLLCRQKNPKGSMLSPISSLKISISLLLLESQDFWPLTTRNSSHQPSITDRHFPLTFCRRSPLLNPSFLADLRYLSAISQFQRWQLRCLCLPDPPLCRFPWKWLLRYSHIMLGCGFLLFGCRDLDEELQRALYKYLGTIVQESGISHSLHVILMAGVVFLGAVLTKEQDLLVGVWKDMRQTDRKIGKMGTGLEAAR